MHSSGAPRALAANDPRSASRCLERTGREVPNLWWTGNPVEPPAPADRPTRDPDLVVSFGFLNHIKSVHNVYDGLSALRRDRPRLRWRIIGPFDPARDAYHAELASTFSPDWVEFTGAVASHDRLRPLLAEASAMILPFADGASTRRGTLQLAWAFGLPAVTTAPREPTDAIVDNCNCLLVIGDGPESWSLAVGRALGDPALARRLREGGLASAERFSWARLADAHMNLYKNLLGKN